MEQAIKAKECAVTPRCSVVVPVFNGERCIRKTLDSVLSQTIRDLDILVVDDASTDGTGRIVKELAARDARVRYFLQPRNMGVAAARNRGVAEARADWVAFLDADDLWLPQKLERQLSVCLENGVPLCYTGASFITNDGTDMRRVVHVPPQATAARLLYGNPIVTSTVLARRDTLLRFPMERDDLHEDLICWYKILQAYGSAAGIDEALTRYRLSSSSKSGNKRKSARMTWQTYRYLGLPIYRAAGCFVRYALHGINRYVLPRKRVSSVSYKFYLQHLADKPLFINAAFLWNCRVKSRFLYGSSCTYAPPAWQMPEEHPNLASLRVALIADEMTCRNFDGLCETKLLSPQAWLSQLESFRPHLLFCESAWTGAAAQKECWRWKVYRHQSLWFENRRELMDILAYCRAAGVPTLFWNKEDPTFFDDAAHDFVSTALHFDHVFTTDAACLPRYAAHGCKNVSALSFGYSPALFYPLEGAFDPTRAVFFGSWFGDQLQRCADMQDIFDMILSKGVLLEIYDRQAGSGDSRHAYPDRYRAYVRPGVPYDAIRATIGRPCYAVNINTVTDSDTMYARRVLEMMACGCIVVSNASAGLRRRFGERIWFAGEPFDEGRAEEIRQRNILEVQAHDTWRARFETALRGAGIAYR